jgi:hypothetical protein
MIFKKISPKNSANKLAFLTQNKGKLCEILIVTLLFEKNANFFAEHCRKSQKIVFKTSTPDCRIFAYWVVGYFEQLQEEDRKMQETFLLLFPWCKLCML